MYELNNFDSIKIGLASPEKIRSWSYGEVAKPETINYRTQKPEREGLFCERIFGPTKDWECHCGKYKRIRYKGVVCDKCGVEVTKSKVRRDRMGHIELAAPVSHIWYFRGVPSRIGLILDMSPKNLEQILYFNAYVVLEPGETSLAYKQILPDKEYREFLEQYGARAFRVGMGGEAIKELLSRIDLEKESNEAKEILKKATGQKRLRVTKRLEILEAFRKSGNSPTWMVMEVLPVIPPELRPMVQLDGGRFATSDLNDLYRRVINRNNRLKKLVELGAPDIIIRNEKRMLQEAVDALIDNGRRGKPVSGAGGRELKSLSGMLRGKQGRFRQNLLGKRVDYSGRSVIVVGPELKIYQCGLPKEMALELFRPFVMFKLVEGGHANNIKAAKRIVERGRPIVWDMLEIVIKDHPVLLNRAPTLHRLGIQAFEPVLVEGRALKIPPLVCTAFNADFDGDQMPVHVPLSIEAQVEARFLMLSTNNILKLSDGKPVVSPTQDMVMGAFYLTMERGEKDEGNVGYNKIFASADEAISAYEAGDLSLQSIVHIRLTSVEGEGEDAKVYSKRVTTTVGRIIFNKAIPQDLGFVDRSTPEGRLDLEINFQVGKPQLSDIVDACFRLKGSTETSIVLDNIKTLGFKYSTIGAITTSVFDMHVPKAKPALLAEATKQVVSIERQYSRGLKSSEERYLDIVRIWNETTDKVTEELKKTLDKFNPILMMASSGARGNMNQIRQLCGMRGLMTNPSGKIIELPVRNSFREGLTVLEYFISSHGGRKGLADTALKTADSGYLTRRLVDVSHDVIVKEVDCFETLGDKVIGVSVGSMTGEFKEEIIQSMADRILGRVTVGDVIHPKTKAVLAKNDTLLEESHVKDIVTAGIKAVNIRTVLTCKSPQGVCSKCYGKNMASRELVGIGEAVGIIAAQSIGEPGTQLTMRTFHTGGIAQADDITQGLPRVEELFESRRPKGVAIISEINGTVTIREKDGKREISVKNKDDERVYPLPFASRLKVTTGDKVGIGEPLTEGSIFPNDILKTKGVIGVQEYLIKEVQTVYRLQGVEINDKHIEVIVRQMLRKVKVEEANDSEMLSGELIDIFKFDSANKQVLQSGGMPATAKRILLGITKAALATDSFLSAASFQETAKVLTDAAIKNKIDPLLGLKENVIIGKLIPAGTGVQSYRNLIATPKNPEDDEFETDDENLA